MSTVTYAEAQLRLAELLDQVVEDREPVIITRDGHEPVALVAADELNSLIETVHLLRSRTNAERLLTALARAKAMEGTPTSIAELRADLKPDDE